MRPKAEWLVLPLLVLPLVLAVGVCMWASGVHERDLDAYRVRGREQLQRMVAQDDEAAGFAENWQGRSFSGAGKEWLPVREGDTHLRVFMAALGRQAWNFADTYPAGLSPESIASPETRLKIETGTAPMTLPEIDEPTRAFRGLMREPNLAALRIVNLPATTKRYIAEHWLKSHSETWMRAAVTLARAVETLTPHLPPHLNPGYHVVAGFDIEVPKSGPIAVPLRDIAFPPRRVAADPLQEGVSLWFGKQAMDAVPGRIVLWQERAEAPVAGLWAFTYSGGPNWWQAPRFKAWVGAGVAAMLLLLAIPAALWFTLRRRRKLDEARTRFINELAHDLRTPLTSLRLHAEMLGSGRTPEDRRPQYLSLIQRESSRLSALLGNLLDLSRLDGTRAALHPQSLTVSSAVEQALHAFVAVHPDRAGDLTLEGDEAVTVRADAAALARVLGNLLENAGKFTQAGTPIRVSWSPDGSRVRLTVADDGPGIPASEQRTIFDRYARGSAAKRDGVAGSGLGLALVKELTTRMEGTIRLEPTTQGATFRIRLPRGEHA